jgi:hypothetical protein
MEGYFGHIEDICRGAYVIKDIYLNKTDTVKQTHIKLCTVDIRGRH